MSMWRVCPACGSLVADVDAHLAWHGSLPPGQSARLVFGHPRDWPRTPGAPTVEIPLEPPMSVIEVTDATPTATEPAPTEPAPPPEEAP